MTLEDLGWILDTKYTNENEYHYNRNDEYLIINFDKKKIETNDDELSFATLEAIRDIILDNAIY